MKHALTDHIMKFLQSKAQYTYTIGRGEVESMVEEFLEKQKPAKEKK